MGRKPKTVNDEQVFKAQAFDESDYTKNETIEQPVTTAYELNSADGINLETPILDEPLQIEENGEIRQEKRGRKPRQAKTDKPPSRAEKAALSKQIEAAHQIAALVTGIRELELTATESEQLGAAIADVLRFHNIEVDPKTAAYLNLLFVAGSVYGLRGYAYYQRKKAEKTQIKTPEQRAEQVETAPVTFETVGDKEQAPPNQLDSIVDELLSGEFEANYIDDVIGYDD